jgi:cobalt transport protein ATP-binding subunit
MSAALELTRLSYRYRDGHEALRDVSLRVEPGECIGLIGPNGSGKSTLLLHLNGILPERADGAVRVHGEAISSANLHLIRRQVGLLFQNPDDQLFCATVGEDVSFGPLQLGLGREAVAERVERALAQVGLQGYNPRSTHHLSQGEKRRVCLAGVLACEPSILVLDEPTSDLDPRGRREFKALLSGISATKVIATHDLEMVVEMCPRSVVLDGGRVIADGATTELLGDEELMLAHGLERPGILGRAQPSADRPFKVTVFNPGA